MVPVLTEDIKEIDLPLVTANADHNQLQDSFMNKVDKLRYDMEATLKPLKLSSPSSSIKSYAIPHLPTNSKCLAHQVTT